MSNNGWITLHRKIMECWVWNNPLYLKAWLHILFSANYKDKKILFDGKVITVERGQFITSQRKLADEWGCDVKTVRRLLGIMEGQEMVTISTTGKGTLLTVVNYDFYQSLETPTPTPAPTPNGTLDGTLSGTQAPTPTPTLSGHNIINNNNNNNFNNGNNGNKDNNDLLIPPTPLPWEPEQKPKKKSSPTFEFDFDSVLEGYTWTPEMKALVKSFFTDYRKAIKKPYKTEWGIKKQLKAIEEEISVSGEGFVEECINETMRNEWEGIFFNRDRKRKSPKQETRQESKEEYLTKLADKWHFTQEANSDETGNTEIIDAD